MRNTLFTILAFLLISNAFADTEPNDSWQDALALPQGRSVAGSQYDDDWYVINISSNQSVKRLLIDLIFSHADGNIDMDFYSVGSSQELLWRDSSDGATTDDEFIDHNATVDSPETYYIRVSGENKGNGYTLTWTELTDTDDGFEPNDSNAATKAITEGVVAFGAHSDPDWYSIDVTSDNRRVLASLRFYNTHLDATIDLDLELHDPDGTLLTSPPSASGINKAINFVVATAGIYHLHVDGDIKGDGYALNWAGVSTGSSVDFPMPAVNEAPQATANTISTTENIPYHFMASDFTFSDSEGDSLVSATLDKLSLAGGILTHSSGTPVNNADTLTAAQLDTLVYTPPTDATGLPLASFAFTVNDFDVGTVDAPLSINVTAAPDSGSSSGALAPASLLILLLSGLLRRKRC